MPISDQFRAQQLHINRRVLYLHGERHDLTVIRLQFQNGAIEIGSTHVIEVDLQRRAAILIGNQEQRITVSPQMMHRTPLMVEFNPVAINRQPGQMIEKPRIRGREQQGQRVIILDQRTLLTVCEGTGKTGGDHSAWSIPPGHGCAIKAGRMPRHLNPTDGSGTWRPDRDRRRPSACRMDRCACHAPAARSTAGRIYRHRRRHRPAHAGNCGRQASA